MGIRFQKRIKVLPGVTINASKSGLSTSLGPRGARVTVGHGQTRTTVGMPGTGLSHTTIESNQDNEEPARRPSARAALWAIVLAMAAIVVIALVLQR